MSLFGDIAGSLLGQGGQSAVAGHLTQVLDEHGGGLGGLAQRFEQAGLGNVMASWVGNGPNASVTPDQLQSVLGPDLIAHLTQRTGLPVDQLLPLVAQHLPGVVDSATPTGQVPPAGGQAPAAGGQPASGDDTQV
jgi:uncharacterized protein YidB (DUF937 family)